MTTPLRRPSRCSGRVPFCKSQGGGTFSRRSSVEQPSAGAGAKRWSARAGNWTDPQYGARQLDDDQRIRDRPAQYLSENGFRITTANDAACARASMGGLVFDLVLLDVMMPGESGLNLARDLKTISNVPVCMLTARADPDHRIEGLEIGVDDFVPKPFELRELVLRLRNILRRGRGPSGPREEIKMGDYVFHVDRGELNAGRRASS